MNEALSVQQQEAAVFLIIVSISLMVQSHQEESRLHPTHGEQSTQGADRGCKAQYNNMIHQMQILSGKGSGSDVNQ